MIVTFENCNFGEVCNFWNFRILKMLQFCVFFENLKLGKLQVLYIEKKMIFRAFGNFVNLDHLKFWKLCSVANLGIF